MVVDRVAYSDKLMSSDCREDTTKSRTLDDTFGWVFFSIDELLESAAVRASKVLYGQNIKAGGCGNLRTTACEFWLSAVGTA